MPHYRFGDFELDSDRYRLTCRGEPIHLEPRVLELLALLVEHRDRVVPREELLERLWPQQFVTESALSRCVYEARRALGESSRRPRYLHTVHRRGYRFQGEVVAASRAGADVGSEPSLGTDLAFGPLIRRRIGLAGVVAVVLAAAVWLLRDAVLRAPDSPGEVASNVVRVAVLPVSPRRDSPEVVMLALSMTDLIANRLRDVPNLVLRPPDYSATEVTKHQSLAEFALAAGVNHVVSGTVDLANDAGRASLSMRLTTVQPSGGATSSAVGSFELPLLTREAETALFARTRDAVVARLLERLTPALTPALTAGSMALPADAEAYRLYLVALQGLTERFCDGAAIGLLEQVVERDPAFAQGWFLLATAHYNQVWACGADASHFERGTQALEETLRHDPDHVPAQVARATLLIETGRLEEAYEHLLAVSERHADHLMARASRLYALRHAGYLDEAERLLRVILEADPLYFQLAPHGEAPNTLLYLGRLEEYLVLLPAGDASYHRYYRGLAEMLLDRPQVASEVLAPAFRDNPADVFGRFAQALLMALQGDAAAARSIVGEIARQRASLGAVDGEITYKQAQLLALAGDLDGAAEQFRLAVEQGFLCVPYFRQDPLLAPIRSLPDYREALAAAEARHRAFGERFALR